VYDVLWVFVSKWWFHEECVEITPARAEHIQVQDFELAVKEYAEVGKKCVATLKNHDSAASNFSGYI